MTDTIDWGRAGELTVILIITGVLALCAFAVLRTQYRERRARHAARKAAEELPESAPEDEIVPQPDFLREFVVTEDGEHDTLRAYREHVHVDEAELMREIL